MSSAEYSYEGVSRAGPSWSASLEINGKMIRMGLFETQKGAAIARDMELLRHYGQDAAGLNFDYEVIDESQGELRVMDCWGRTISVTLAAKSNVYAPIEPPPRKKRPIDVVTASFVLPSGWPLASINLLPWADRTQTSSTASAAFSYEISFPFQSSLGLNLKPHSLMFPQAGGAQFIGCLIIVDAVPYLSSIVQPGDILLCVNKTELIAPGHIFEFEKATRAITTADVPRVLRLMRSYCPAFPPSAAEVKALAKEQSPPIQFQVSVLGPSPSQRTVSLKHADPQLPSVLKKQIQGCVVPFNQVVMPQPLEKAPLKTYRHPSQVDDNIKFEDAMSIDGTESYIATGCIFRERVYYSNGPGVALLGVGFQPGGGGLALTASGGLMISNSSTVSSGKWCAYISIENAKNVAETTVIPTVPSAEVPFGACPEVVAAAETKKTIITQVGCGTVRRYLVGKYDTEAEAKANMELAFEIVTSTGTFSPSSLTKVKTTKRTHVKDVHSGTDDNAEVPFIPADGFTVSKKAGVISFPNSKP